jgi:hypothetical protein
MRSTVKEMKPVPKNSVGSEEYLVIDERTAMRPAEKVETKVGQLLHTSFVGISHIMRKRVITKRPVLQG